MKLTIAEQIKIFCSRAGISEAGLAERLHQSRANFNQKMKRDNFRVSELEEIAAAMGLDLVIEFREKPTDGTP